MANHIEELKHICSLLKNQRSVPFAQECLDEIVNTDILFYPYGNKMNRQDIYTIYSGRQKLQQVLSDKIVYGYEYLLEHISEEKVDLLLSKITTNKGSYMLFLPETKDRIVGILKSTKINLARGKELQDYYIHLGLEDRGESYYKMKPL